MDAPASNYRAHAASSGEHKTICTKDAQKAMERKMVRVGYEARTQYWAADDMDTE